jgi:hypothetical protein
MSRKKYIKNINIFKVVASKWILGILMFSLFLAAPKALGIGAASFFLRRRRRSGKRYSGKPDGFAGTPKERQQDYKTTRQQVVGVME